MGNEEESNLLGYPDRRANPPNVDWPRADTFPRTSALDKQT
jgi:hypothetical protein